MEKDEVKKKRCPDIFLLHPCTHAYTQVHQEMGGQTQSNPLRMDVWSMFQNILAHPLQWKGETSGTAGGSVGRQEAPAGPCVGRDTGDLYKTQVFRPYC